MKKVLFFVGLLLLCLFVGSVSAMSGNGDADNPWIITTPEDLTALSGTGLAGYGANAYYELGADIDMSSVASFTPIGTSNYAFIGHFDGKNHTINGLRISFSGTNGCGMFYKIDGGTRIVISNIIFESAHIVGNSSTGTGVISGRIGSNTNITLDNIHVRNSYITSSKEGVGALCGYCSLGTNMKDVHNYISNCSVESCIIIGNYAVAGICGYSGTGASTYMDILDISGCNIINCYIWGNHGVAGIVADSRFIGTISSCNISYCTIIGGTVTGIYGYNLPTTGNIQDCIVSDCSIIGTTNACGVGN